MVVVTAQSELGPIAAEEMLARLPMFRLDRIYTRRLAVVDTRVHYAFPWGRLSDHAALGATFETVKRRR